MSLNQNNLYEFGGFRIDLSERTLWHKDEFIALPPKVMETLCLLVESGGRLLTKDELIEELWADTFVEERNLTQNIFTLRKVLSEREKGGKFIETIPRRGYRFVAEIHPVETRSELIQVSHNKQTRISAEGFVSRQELTEAVKEIAKSLVSGNEIEAVPTKQFTATKTKRFYQSAFFPAAIALSFFAFGLAVWSWQSNYFNFWKPSLMTSAERPLLTFERLTHSGKVFFPALSPGKQFVAYVFVNQGKYSLELQNIATGSKTVVVEPTEREISRPEFSADGNYLFYRQEEKTGGTGIVYQIPIFGGSPRLIVSQVNSNVSVSPDGEWLSFIRFKPEINGQQLIICRSRDGSGEKVISTRTGNESFIIWGFSPSWSPDGKKLFAGLVAEPTPEKPDARGEGFGLISVEDGSFEKIITPQWNNFIQAKWMPDGKSLLFLAREKANETYQIWQVAYPGGEGRRITNDSHDYRHLSIAADSEFILASQEREFFNLWLIPADNPNDARQLTFSSELIHGERGISWMPDGKELIYTMVENNVNSNLWKINVETLEKSQITFDKHHINYYPQVTPDGKSVVFSSNRENGMHIWQMDLDGANLRRITDGVGESFSNITADGKWLIYASPAWSPESLWKKSLTSDEKPVKLLTAAAGSNSVSPDNKHLVVSYKITGESGRLEYKYGIMPLEPTETPSDIGFNPYFGAIAWKKDSSGFYYLKDLGMNLNNIWFYDIKTKTHRQITNFDNQMLSLSLSSDENILATARGETVANVFKISGF
jgi:Tol biopolymer transport system component/DNA-binding winged helix-turn-helix (wHTH) protein